MFYIQDFQNSVLYKQWAIVFQCDGCKVARGGYGGKNPSGTQFFLRIKKNINNEMVKL